ncbi:MAG: ComEC/Rec2 family competence protein [Acidimicrobiales bacterium]
MLAIEMLPAGHGDALVIEYGKGSATHRVLVDGGPLHSWEGVRARLLAMPDRRYEAFVVTHVDEDHIGGAVRLLVDPDLRHRVRDVWFNGFVHCRRGGDVLGPVDGERLTRAIADGDYAWNAPFPRRVGPGVGGPAVVPAAGPLPSFSLPGGGVLHLLSPTAPKLKKMATVWEEVVEQAGLVGGAGTDRPARPPKPHGKKVVPLAPGVTAADLEALAAKSPQDGSEANGSSIAFLFEFGGQRALLGADAHADVLVSSLRRFGASVGEDRVRIHLCKLPHHASRANVTTELVEAMDVSRYLVSTNGDTFGHPDDAVLARLLRSSARPATIHCNYATDRTTPWRAPAAAFGVKVVMPAAGAAGLRVSATA